MNEKNLNLLFTYTLKERILMISDASPGHIAPIRHRYLGASITGSSSLNMIFCNTESSVAINISFEAVIADYYSKQP